MRTIMHFAAWTLLTIVITGASQNHNYCIRRNANPGSGDKSENVTLPSASQQQNTTMEASFLEWDKWTEKYPDCNPETNPFASPIDISTSDVISAKSIQTLFIHSGEPERDTYLLSTFHVTDDYHMEALNVKLQGEQALGHATIVSGLGKSSKRFFDSAVLLIKGKDFKGTASINGGIHTIDYKKYPMEIVLTFMTNSGEDETQIHVMVEVMNETNPVWLPLTNLYDKMCAKIIEDTCFGNVLRQNGKDAYDKAVLHYTKLLTKQKEELDRTTYQERYEEIKICYEIVKCCDSEKLKELHDEANTEDVKIQGCHKDLSKHQEFMETARKKIEELKTKIQQLKENEQLYDNEEDTLNQENLEFKKLKEREDELNECITKHGNRYSELQKQISNSNRIRKENEIGSDDQHKFKSVAQVLEKMNEVKKNMEELEKAKISYENARYELEAIESIPSRSVDVELPFQISWLFPPYGGHYFYNGSSPLPPCEKKPFAIVLEKPISISSEQLLVFQKIPSIHQRDPSVWKRLCDNSLSDGQKAKILDTMDKIVSQVPKNKVAVARKVWYNPKNLQYKMDDGVHMKSSTRRKLKLELENEERNKASAKFCQTVLNLICVIIYTLN
ncbi:Carbonic anhydrase 3 [Orchesella cincta]|uniref:Carbonic anhydrase 3 n=1 Tax=Orchesella cincta TaxID=48709 RepID=A0A1D2MQG9_ORCCI|nr:Carbonic anhydrase 3 [Orchesella cincta]